MNTLQEMRDVIDAAIAGKAIQRDYGNAQWLDTNPLFNFSVYTYRVKPEPKPDVRFDYSMQIGRVTMMSKTPNLKCTFSGEDGSLKSAEVIK